MIINSVSFSKKIYSSKSQHVMPKQVENAKLPDKYNQDYNYYPLITFGSTKKNLNIMKSHFPEAIKKELIRISSLPTEEGVLFKDGVKINTFDGTRHTVNITSYMLKKLTTENADYILIHNHPDIGANPVTPDDAWITYTAGCQEIVAVHPDGTFSSVSFRNIPKVRDYYSALEKVERITDELQKKYQKAIKYLQRANGFNFANKKPSTISSEELNELWKVIAPELSLEYITTHDYKN